MVLHRTGSLRRQSCPRLCNLLCGAHAGCRTLRPPAAWFALWDSGSCLAHTTAAAAAGWSAMDAPEKEHFSSGTPSRPETFLCCGVGPPADFVFSCIADSAAAALAGGWRTRARTARCRRAHRSRCGCVMNAWAPKTRSRRRNWSRNWSRDRAGGSVRGASALQSCASAARYQRGL